MTLLDRSCYLFLGKEPGFESKLPYVCQHDINDQCSERKAELPSQQIVMHDDNVEAGDVDEKKDHTEYDQSAHPHGLCHSPQIVPKGTVRVATVESAEHDDESHGQEGGSSRCKVGLTV